MNLESTLLQFEHDFNALLACAPPSRAQTLLASADHVYLLAPTSLMGLTFAPILARRLTEQGKRVFLVDDLYAAQGDHWQEWPVLSSDVFVSQAFGQSAAVSVNMSSAPFAHGYFSQLSARAQMAELDMVPVLDVLDVPVVYQTASAMRAQTIARADDYRKLARRLADPLSIKTLLAMLTLRLNFDRTALLPILCSPEDEYFASYPGGSTDTFKLGEKEVLCDIGAHVGTTVRKFVTATRWQYAAIHAFEPDIENFAHLEKNYSAKLENFQAHNIALSDARSTMRFSQTGTMGSRLDSDGNTEIQVLPLDEVLDYATFIKMDVEGHETGVLRGARKLIQNHKPRLAVTGYHFADDLLDIADLVLDLEPEYQLRLRQHYFYYYDSILYAQVLS
ncbi:FkbM family methyltransferase [Pseudomonas putida]|uniref:FkbM family methyltransferase n=1 Tax=Pseudomonas putida TaxID=303 RepID=A0A2Z4RSV8_PSEPU|nr:FkbM family methyltransferase [Pseudomonas putida]AWY44190.1 FkbM family methyltransferase [Pseudomonas putida]